jgi:hypothetical protein
MALIEVSLKETKPLVELWSASNTLKSAVRGPANKHAHNRGLQQLHSIVMMGEEKVGRFCYGGKIVERGKVGIGSIS